MRDDQKYFESAVGSGGADSPRFVEPYVEATSVAFSVHNFRLFPRQVFP